jgi:hypothetical protein
MSTLNEFIIFQCDTCNRQTELQIDGKRIDPIRCIITYKCRGKLSRVGQSAVKKFLVTPPVSGLQDYIPRGTVLSSSPVITPTPNVSLNTGGGSGMLSMAILTKTDHPATHDYSVLGTNGQPIFINVGVSNNVTMAQNVKIVLNIFPISASVLQSTTYTYLKTGEVQVINGPDDSPDSIVLRFSASNNIRVYTNGVELSPSAYIISVPNQSITFTPAIYESNNVVNIIVYNDIVANVSTANIVTLEFDVLDPMINLPPPYVSDLTFLEACAWGNFNAVNIQGNERYLMHCTDLSALSKDVSYGVESIQVVIGTPIPAGSFVIGTSYTIYYLGTTNWQSIGAAPNATVGTVFIATGPGTNGSTGTAIVNAPIDVMLSEANLLMAKDPYEFQDKELNAYLNGSSFDASFSFTFAQDPHTGIYKFTAPQTKFIQLLHSMIPVEPFSSTLFAKPSTAGATTSTTSIKHSYIIGPT